MNIRLTIEYDGSRYCGWQVQPNGISIQSVLESAIATFFAKPARVTGSGRTDAGVHALGQVANFRVDSAPDFFRLVRGLNALTPPDITIKEASAVADEFDARRDGRSRTYEYLILNRATPSPFYLNRAWHVHEKISPELISAARTCLVGEHDFSSFRAAACEAAHPVRKVYRNSLERRGELLVYTIEATAFLRHMVRNIVGTLVEVGRGLRTPAEFRDLLAARDRTQAGRTAPPGGLYLLEVKY